MQLNPARGRKLDVWRRHAATRISRRGLCSSTPRGDGNVQSETREPSRKPVGLCSSTPRGDGNFRPPTVDWRGTFSLVYAAQPREGTETGDVIRIHVLDMSSVYAAQPREGTETCTRSPFVTPSGSWVYAAQPREGTETTQLLVSYKSPPFVVYAAQPREGTETSGTIALPPVHPPKGLCSSTPRGDGN